MVFLALGLYEGQRQLGTDQRDVWTQLEQVRYAADMVFVAMGEYQGLDLVETVLDVVEIRQDQVNARLLLLREKHAAIDEQQVAVVFDHVHVAADFAETAKRHDTHRALAVLRRGDQHIVLLGGRGELLWARSTARGRTAGITGRRRAGAAAGMLAAPARIALVLFLFFCHFLVGFLLLSARAYTWAR